MVLNTVFRMTFRCFRLLSYRNTGKACDNLPSELNLSNIQMSEKPLSDPGHPYCSCTLGALGECLQSWGVVFLFVFKADAYLK